MRITGRSFPSASPGRIGSRGDSSTWASGTSDTETFEAEAETLLGSPRTPVFYDVGLAAGKTVFYRVRAVDAWGNHSPASAASAVTACRDESQ